MRAPGEAPVFPGKFFDGRSSRLQEAEARLAGGAWSVSLRGGESLAPLTFPEKSVRIVRAVGSIPAVLIFPDGSRFECGTGDLQVFLSGRSKLDLVEWLEGHWKAAAAATFALLAFFVVTYIFFLPVLAKRLAPRIPDYALTKISDGVRSSLDAAKIFTPSTLDAIEKQRLEKIFARASSIRPAERATLYSRAMRGDQANAFALPDGAVFVTDALVRKLKSDDEILAVLLHELGHVRNRHGMKMLIEGSALSILFFLYTGGTESLGLIYALMANGYSRDHENEADDYAARALLDSSMPPKLLADALRHLVDAKEEKESLKFFRSHPHTPERAARLESLTAADLPKQ